jgi:hypothetical protein
LQIETDKKLPEMENESTERFVPLFRLLPVHQSKLSSSVGKERREYEGKNKRNKDRG